MILFSIYWPHRALSTGMFICLHVIKMTNLDENPMEKNVLKMPLSQKKF